MSKLRESQSWTEHTSYVECPYCDNCINLGDARVYENYEGECYECKKSFLILAEIQ